MFLTFSSLTLHIFSRGSLSPWQRFQRLPAHHNVAGYTIRYRREIIKHILNMYPKVQSKKLCIRQSHRIIFIIRQRIEILQMDIPTIIRKQPHCGSPLNHSLQPFSTWIIFLSKMSLSLSLSPFLLFRLFQTIISVIVLFPP